MMKNTVYLSRRYNFSASHRLYTDSLSKEANEQIFGKCANPNGHGHNYGLTVTIRGNIDEASGFVLPLELLDSIVFDKVISAYDHKYLNVDVEDYFTNVPTGENMVYQIWERLNSPLKNSLWRVTLDETRNNQFIYPEPKVEVSSGI